MRSPRSVSTTSIPAFSSPGVEVALLGEHRLALDQPGDAPLAEGPRTIALCSAASAAQCTGPRGDRFPLELLEYSGRREA
jgi:hypothetical protein